MTNTYTRGHQGDVGIIQANGMIDLDLEELGFTEVKATALQKTKKQCKVIIPSETSGKYHYVENPNAVTVFVKDVDQQKIFILKVMEDTFLKHGDGTEDPSLRDHGKFPLLKGNCYQLRSQVQIGQGNTATRIVD